MFRDLLHESYKSSAKAKQARKDAAFVRAAESSVATDVHSKPAFPSQVVSLPNPYEPIPLNDLVPRNTVGFFSFRQETSQDEGAEQPSRPMDGKPQTAAV